MSIKQFNGTYHSHEDRVMFRFNTIESQEYRFWLTRRITLFILSAANHLLAKKLEDSHDKAAARTITNFQREAAHQNMEVEKGSVSELYESGQIFPLGSDPVLVMDVKCQAIKEDHAEFLSLDFILPANGNLNLKLVGPTLQAMCCLLDSLRISANWGESVKIEAAVECVQTFDDEKNIKHHLH